MMFNSPSLPSLRISALFALALSGAGCTIIVDDHGDDHGHDAQENAWERCYDGHEDCLDEADGAMDAVFSCNEELDRCTGANAEDPTTGGAVESTNTSADQDDEGGQPPAEICVLLHQACLTDAEDVAETLACEALFDHCAHPEQCQEQCPQACPEQGLAACLDDYGGCVGGAVKDYEVEACNFVFHGCIEELGAAMCLPEDDAHVESCLTEHVLCTACAEGEAELAACQSIFDICVNPPM